MKIKGILLAIVGIVFVAANIVLLYTQNSRFDIMSSKLDQMEVQLAGIRSGVNSQNSIQPGVAIRKEVFTPMELAEYLNIEMDSIYDIIDAQDLGIPYICINGEYRFSKEAIDQWLKTNRIIQTGN